MVIKTFKQAEEYLSFHIPRNSEQTFPGELGLNRAKYFLQLLGRPQEKIKVIHVAGTSGKGSTCYLINSLLVSMGFKVGLHQSPHLTDVRERYQINSQIITEKEFLNYLNKILPIINLVGKTFHGTLTYFEILVGIAFLIFSEKKVDYAVIETGLGGRYDGTKVVSRQDKLSIISKIGMDHTNILGKTIEKIALQKAMIINEKSQAISISQDPEAEKVIRELVEKKQAKIIFADNNHYKLNLIGDYQQENTSLALSAVNYLSQRDGFILNKIKVKNVFEIAKFPGRFDIKRIANKIVIFDGAHNPQKMEAFIGSLIKKYSNKKFTFLLAFKKGKNYQDMLKIIIPWASSITLTSFNTKNQDMINASVDPVEIGRGIARNARTGFNYKIISDLKEAWEEILKTEDPFVVTGSLYLVGEIFRLIKSK
jgi:dihydrofolate synthase/folylpolyglutamate synthase